MASLKTAVKNYFLFCKNSSVPIDIKHSQLILDANTENAIDSYQNFLTYFNIGKKDLFDWGISSTIFPPVEKAEIEWEALKKRIFNNQTVYIRGYGRDAHGTQLYKDMYAKLFNNSHVEKDPTNNAIPHRIIQDMTELKRNHDIFNYQVSHIWGHTKNIFMFEAPWNICYTPKIMDPFTGHETQGAWPMEYQRLFFAKAYELYRPFINEYNDLLIALNIEERLQEYFSSLKNFYSEKELVQFSKDAINELSPIK